jgi:hypothetical protein
MTTQAVATIKAKQSDKKTGGSVRSGLVTEKMIRRESIARASLELSISQV